MLIAMTIIRAHELHDIGGGKVLPCRSAPVGG
jgi:hypothetical protein